MEIIPATTLATITTTFGDTVAANALPIVGVVALGVGVAFVTRWFTKSTRRIKA